MSLKLTLSLSVASLAAVGALSELLEVNGFDAENFTLSGDLFDVDAEDEADAPLAAAAAPGGAPTPPSASAPEPAKRTRKAKGAEAPPAGPPASVFAPQPGITQADIDAPVSPALGALVGEPNGIPAAPQPPAAAPAPPAPPPASPAPAAALVDPANYAAPANITPEVLQAAMGTLLASGLSASQAQAFLVKNTGYKAIKDLPAEWYPVTHWCLATGRDREGV